MREHLAEIDAIGDATGAADLRQHGRPRSTAPAACSTASAALFHNLTLERDLAGAAGGASARWRRCWRRTTARVYMHAALFARIDALHERRDELGLDAEQLRLLERFHLDFVRAGARLGAARRRRAMREVMQRLAELTTRFGQNVLADEAAFRLVLRSEADLAGLPDVRARRGAPGGASSAASPTASVITLSRSHIVPFLTFSRAARPARAGLARLDGARRARRRDDNRALAREILALRARAGAPARLRQLRRLRAGRHHGAAARRR